MVFRGGGRTIEGQGHGQGQKEVMEVNGNGGEKVQEQDGEVMLNGTGAIKVANGNAKEGKRAEGKGKAREFFEGSMDCVCMLDDSHFVSGGDSGYVLTFSNHNDRSADVWY